MQFIELPTNTTIESLIRFRITRMETFLKSLRTHLPCRDNQLAQIYNYIGDPDDPVPPCLYLYGNTSTGKTACLTSALEHFSYKHVVLNVIECYTQRILYETILNKLSGHLPTRETKYAPAYRCDNMKDFVNHLNDMECGYEPVVIVLENAGKLRDMDQNILPAFMRLKEYCSINVCTILVSDVPFERFYMKTGLREPIKIFFPQYSKDELFKIILTQRSQYVNYVLQMSDTKTDISEPDIFANYLNAFLSVFYRPCRDLVELKHMVRLNFVKYCEPILNGSTKSDDVTKLWRNIAPVLKSSLETLYLRLNANGCGQNEDPNCREMQMRMERLGITREEDLTKKSDGVLTNELTSMKTFAQSFELPFYAKFLLISAYLASFNPAKEDKRLFVKYHGKKKKRMQQVNANAKLTEK